MSAICPSHPWITFSVDMRRASPQLWLLLGEARSKCNHLAGVPLSTPVAKDLHEIFLAKGIHATSAIEGNTLTEEDVLRIIRSGAHHEKGDSYEETEIKNIVDATNEILDIVERHGVQPITVADIKKYNKQILDGLAHEDHVIPGEFSQVQVGVPGYRGAPALQSEDLMSRMCEWLNSSDFTAGDEDAIVYGLIKAILAHLYLVWIHPFGDGNGRTARLLEARILLESGAPSAACHLLSDHYNRTRQRYYRELSNASSSGGDVIPFMFFAVEGFVSSLRDQLLIVKNQQWQVSWVNYIHEKFRYRNSKTDKRQRDLILSLTSHGGLVARDKIRLLSPMVAEEYANLSEKTIHRDLNSLLAEGLIRREGDDYIANRELILQFLPRARKGDIEAQMEVASQMERAAELLPSLEESQMQLF